MTITGRLAPSPTGAQHLGNARTYLIAWLSARSRHGRVILRMEDIDSPRVKAGAAAQALDDLRWMGLDWDAGPIFQTERFNLYDAALRSLQADELVYPCTCSRQDVERAASAPHAEHEGLTYPGTCAGYRVADASALSGQYCWRFRTSDYSMAFDDGFCGRQCTRPDTFGGDFVVWKSDATPAYQLAVVVDDADMGVDEVIRGDDLLSSTPRQLLLYRALAKKPPRFVHVPLVVGPDGRRLAKRHGDTRLAALRAGGVSPRSVMGLLAWSCGWMGRIEPCTPNDLLVRFSLQSIPRQPFVLTSELLRRIGYTS